MRSASGTVVFAALVLHLPAASAAGCIFDPSIPGFMTLQELYDAMLDDFLRLLDDEVAPPFKYHLCPGVTYSPAQEGRWIEPLSDETTILCGLEGRSEDGCVVEGDDLHVALIESEIQGYVRGHATFQGITFIGSNGWSVVAYDNDDAEAEFIDCHWKNITGQTAIQIVHKSRPETSNGSTMASAKSQIVPDELTHLPGMTIRLTNCSLIDSWGVEDRYFFGISNANGKLFLEGVRFSNNSRKNSGTAIAVWNEGFAEINSCDFDNNEFDVNIFNFQGAMTVEGSTFHKNKGQSSITAIRGFTGISGNRFIANEFPVSGNIEVLEGYVDIGASEFLATSARSEIIVYGETAELYMESLCFVNGKYAFTPVFIGGIAFLGGSSNIYAHGLEVVGDQQCISPPSVFVQDDSFNFTACFDDNPASPCSGECTDSFDAPTCDFGTPPTPAPTPRPTLNTVQATKPSPAACVLANTFFASAVSLLFGVLMT